CRSEGVERHPAHGNLDVDPVEKRPRQSAVIGVDRAGCAPARPHAVTRPTARTWIGRRDEGEARGVSDRAAGAGDRDPAGLDGLAECLEDRSLELCQLVQEKDSMVGERTTLTTRGLQTS